MAARTLKGTKERPWDDKIRARIRGSMLANRLRDHVRGKIELTPTQVRSAEILLKKVLPDLAIMEIKGEITQNYIVHMPSPVVDLSEWRIQEAIEPDETVPALPKPIEGD